MVGPNAISRGRYSRIYIKPLLPPKLHIHASLSKFRSYFSPSQNMKLKTISIFSFSFIAALCFTVANVATFNIRNNCPFTVWETVVPGGGMRLDRGGVLEPKC
ncbi:hypothetical protein CRYUN_Cryun12cG0042600 [Craigia yunnanensis]